MADHNNDDLTRTRIDASSARLTSLRTTTADAAAAAARRPKFVPKAAKRRPTAEGGADGSDSRDAASAPAPTGKAPQRAGDLTRDRPRSDRGGLSGNRRGRGRGRGRGANLPTGRVTFVGTLSGGSSYSSGGGGAPRPSAPSKPIAAADGVGISVLDDEDGAGMHEEFSAMEIEEQWPPVLKSVMEPMSLPFARRPEPPSAGAIFADENGQVVLENDSLLFLQLPTTLPLAHATRVGTTTEKEEPKEAAPVNKFAVATEPSAIEPVAPKKEDDSVDDLANVRQEEQVFDRSLAKAPGGFVGKLCIHRSGKVVLMLGDKRFDVAAAHTPAFTEELYSIDSVEQQLCTLGAIDRHLVVTPDFDELLA
ncbi:hypothetical protein PINS_up004762 [Pythium insidiosum]|nr:hypothetical protein PINS_up004762 [Pythium insidiosum]